MELETALKLLEKQVDEGEIFCAKEHHKTLETKNGEVDLFKESKSEGYGIRVIKDKRMGFSFSNRLSRAAIDSAIGSAKIAEHDKHLSLPRKQNYGKFRGPDRAIKSLETEDVLGFMDEMLAPCGDYSVIPTSGSVSVLSYEEEIVNSFGLSGIDRGTSINAYLSTVAKGDDISTGFYYDASRTMNLNFEEIGREAARLAKESLNARRLKTIKCNLILKPHAVGDLFENVLLSSFSADSVQRNRSFLAGKVGETIASGLTLVDDGTLKDGLLSAKFDSEGVASKKTSLLKNGVLEGFLYDTYAANKAGIESSGNASRDSYSSLPQIGPTNVVVSGRGDIGEEKGLLAYGLIGAHTSNPVSGDFSVETRNAFLDGRPVKKAIISGNIFELMQNISGFGKDKKQVSSIISPSIEFSDVTVTG